MRFRRPRRRYGRRRFSVGRRRRMRRVRPTRVGIRF